jgi:hypothetical protein
LKFYLPLIFVFCCLGIFFFFPLPELEGKTVALPELSGWTLQGEPQIFSPQTLFEYINGAADLYLDYEFQELAVAEYKGKEKARVVVEIYRHQDPTQAFGIYSQERLAEAEYLDLGDQGYYEPGVANFLNGPYYVKISGFNIGQEEEKVLVNLARKVQETLGRNASLPPILASFPEEGKKKNSEKFISKNFLGYPFFHSAYTADYEKGDNKFKIFVIRGKNTKDCHGLMEKYFQRIGKETKRIAEGSYQLKDPYHGEVDIMWKGKSIWGILGLTDPDLRSQYLKKLKL